jgi:hypothetical protein
MLLGLVLQLMMELQGPLQRYWALKCLLHLPHLLLLLLLTMLLLLAVHLLLWGLIRQLLQ